MSKSTSDMANRLKLPSQRRKDDAIKKLQSGDLSQIQFEDFVHLTTLDKKGKADFARKTSADRLAQLLKKLGDFYVKEMPEKNIREIFAAQRTLTEIKNIVLLQGFNSNESTKDQTTDTLSSNGDLDMLSNEITMKVLSYLKPQELMNTAKVNKGLNLFADSPLLWKQHLPQGADISKTTTQDIQNLKKNLNNPQNKVFLQKEKQKHDTAKYEENKAILKQDPNLKLRLVLFNKSDIENLDSAALNEMLKNPKKIYLGISIYDGQDLLVDNFIKTPKAFQRPLVAFGLWPIVEKQQTFAMYNSRNLVLEFSVPEMISGESILKHIDLWSENEPGLLEMAPEIMTKIVTTDNYQGFWEHKGKDTLEFTLPNNTKFSSAKPEELNADEPGFSPR